MFFPVFYIPILYAVSSSRVSPKFCLFATEQFLGPLLLLLIKWVLKQQTCIPSIALPVIPQQTPQQPALLWAASDSRKMFAQHVAGIFCVAFQLSQPTMCGFKSYFISQLRVLKIAGKSTEFLSFLHLYRQYLHNFVYF